MKAFSFFGTFFIFREESGNDTNFVSAEEEDVDVSPAFDFEGRFFFEYQKFFFLSCSSASRASCSSSWSWTFSAIFRESSLSECCLTRYSKSRRDSRGAMLRASYSRLASSIWRRIFWRFSWGRWRWGVGMASPFVVSLFGRREDTRFRRLTQAQNRPKTANAPNIIWQNQ